jgi:hypothetical protein
MKTITAREALARMKRGDMPTRSGYGAGLVFDDGGMTTSRVGLRLVRTGRVYRPMGGSLHARYTLAVCTVCGKVSPDCICGAHNTAANRKED